MKRKNKQRGDKAIKSPNYITQISEFKEYPGCGAFVGC